MHNHLPIHPFNKYYLNITMYREACYIPHQALGGKWKMQKWSLASQSFGSSGRWWWWMRNQKGYGREESNQRNQAEKWEWLQSERSKLMTSRDGDLVWRTESGGSYRGVLMYQWAGRGAILQCLCWGTHLKGPLEPWSSPRHSSPLKLILFFQFSYY